MEQVAFMPVKIIDRQWAEKLLDGSVFMRSLFEFGPWNSRNQTEKMNNAFRGDIHEGLIRNINPEAGDEYYNTFPPELRKVIANAWYFDDTFFPYLKIYCLYCLRYNLDKKAFEAPDKRLKDFGDTAVIISDLNEFLRRILITLAGRFGDNVNFKMNEISYFDISKDFGNYDIFSKTQFYSWQNELRIALGILDGSQSMVNEKGQTVKPLIRDTNTLTLEIGSIQDIAVAISTDDLIALNLPTKIGLPYKS